MVEPIVSEVNGKNTFTSHIENKIFLTFLLTSLSMLLYRKKVRKKRYKAVMKAGG
jgi:hypothetical protein